MGRKGNVIMAIRIPWNRNEVALDIVQGIFPMMISWFFFGETQMEFFDKYDVVEQTKKQCEEMGVRFLWRSLRLSHDIHGKDGAAQKMRRCCSIHNTAPQIILLREYMRNSHFCGMVMLGVRDDESIGSLIW